MTIDDIIGNLFENTIECASKASILRDSILEKFSDIVFIEEGHRYIVDGKEYIPVSNIIKEFERPVDWDKKAEMYALRNRRRKEDVQKEWRLNNLKSTISGTRTHLFGESYTNLMCGRPELISLQNMPQYVGEYNTLIPTYPKEEAIVRFYDDLEENLRPVGAEFKLSTKYIEGARPICGTCDLLLYDSKSDECVICDWKTNKSLTKDYSRTYGIMMTGCMSGYYDEPLSHYILQFNIYQRMLESAGIRVKERILVWLKDDGTYERISVPKIPDDTIDMIIRGAYIV